MKLNEGIVMCKSSVPLNLAGYASPMQIKTVLWLG